MIPLSLEYYSRFADNKTTQCPHPNKTLSLGFDPTSLPLQTRTHPPCCPPSQRLQSGLTCLQQHLSAVQVLHFVAVVLGVRGAGAGGPGLGPVHFSESLGVELQGVHPTLLGQFHHHPAGHHVPAAEHGRTVHLRGVEDYFKVFQLVKDHFRGFVQVVSDAKCRGVLLSLVPRLVAL